jgi:hypothetical protein
VYSNALLILLGMLVIVMNFLLAILVRSLKWNYNFNVLSVQIGLMQMNLLG